MKVYFVIMWLGTISKVINKFFVTKKTKNEFNNEEYEYVNDAKVKDEKESSHNYINNSFTNSGPLKYDSFTNPGPLKYDSFTNSELENQMYLMDFFEENDPKILVSDYRFTNAHGSLLYEDVRLATFKNPKWSGPISKKELACSGLYYVGYKDHVKCIYCNIYLGYWSPNDNVYTEHKKYSPKCIFLQDSSLTGNIESNHVLCKYYLNHLNRNVKRLHIPQMEDFNNRMTSFKNSNINFEARRKFAEKGFYYCQVGDFMQCYKCSGGLYNWLDGEDPKQRHDKYFPFCNNHERHDYDLRKVQLNDYEKLEIQKLQFVQNILHYLNSIYNTVDILNAIFQFIEINGFLYRDLKSAIDCVDMYICRKQQVNEIYV
ncbi:IAP [Aratus pisonii nudivirus]|nr:IAP [Aratus pisonii nudivirus]